MDNETLVKKLVDTVKKLQKRLYRLERDCVWAGVTKRPTVGFTSETYVPKMSDRDIDYIVDRMWGSGQTIFD